MCHYAWLASLILMLYFLSFRGPESLDSEVEMVQGPWMCCFLCSSPVKKPSLLKIHQFEIDPFDSGSEGPEGLGSCVSSLSILIGTVAETSEEKYRLLDQRDRIMRQGMVCRDKVQSPWWGQGWEAVESWDFFYAMPGVTVLWSSWGYELCVY